MWLLEFFVNPLTTDSITYHPQVETVTNSDLFIKKEKKSYLNININS